LEAEDIDYVEDSTSGAVLSKPFGTIVVPASWNESPELSWDGMFFYLKDGTSLDAPTSNISVNMGVNGYSEGEFLSFRDEVYDQLMAQVSASPGSVLHGMGTQTEKGYILMIFTIENENVGITTRQYYIVGDFRYILVHETDFHDESIPYVTEAARAIVDSFEWAN